ncbi:hypothetical protein [Arsukibacterium indicum]|uniref:Uncharacterized protein n=1 Tax=Arsukibacterium indicum TaxID=2848612 RepID=A0ABS6MPJ5_9GAMM|nr:hypothetical protein [Arsukibacterium indicum]MBV2130752.1 hypothetical protein [Arsukibacterium indicum]
MLVNTVTSNTLNVAATEASNTNRTAAAAPLVADTGAAQNNLKTTAIQTIADAPATNAVQTAEANSESVRVSSSIGRAASAGQLTREQALEIYRNIARFL